MSEKKERKKRIEWTSTEIEYLLEIWDEYVADLRRTKRNSKVYGKMSEKLKDHNVHKSAKEVATKIANLSTRFREERKKSVSSGESPLQWRYFDRVNRIIGAFLVNEDPLIQEPFIKTDHDDSTAFSTSIEPSLSFSFTPIPVEISAPLTSSETPEPSTSTPSPLISQTSGRSTSAKSTGKIKTKKNYSLQKALLKELRRSNKATEKELRISNRLAQQTITLQEQIFKFFKESHRRSFQRGARD